MFLQGQELLPAPLCLSLEAGPASRYATELQAFLFSPLFGSTLSSWAVMVAAMMFPLLLYPVRHVAIRSFAARRRLAFGEFLVGYLAAWTAALAAMLALLIALRAAGGASEAIVGATALIVAAAWQGTKWKQAALRRCHVLPALRAYGWRSDLDCLSFGLRHGAACVTSCWAAMLALVLGGHHLATMAVISAIMFAERYERRPQIVASQLVLLMLAAIAFLHP